MQSRGPIVVAAAIAALVAVAIAFPPADAPREPAPPAAAGEREAIGAMVREYLLDNPEVIVEAMQRLEVRERAAEARRRGEAIGQHRAALFEAPEDPYLGPADAAVTMVEFFDYQCPYCKRVAEDLVSLVETNPDLKIVFKEFPVFGDASMLAARAALAADRQGRYEEFHLAMMALRGAPTEAGIEATAASLDLDIERFRRDMDDPGIDRAIAQNRALADRIGVTGTPAFVIGDQLVPGAIGKAEMESLVARHREG